MFWLHFGSHHPRGGESLQRIILSNNGFILTDSKCQTVNARIKANNKALAKPSTLNFKCCDVIARVIHKGVPLCYQSSNDWAQAHTHLTKSSTEALEVPGQSLSYTGTVRILEQRFSLLIFKVVKHFPAGLINNIVNVKTGPRITFSCTKKLEKYFLRST